MKIQTVETLGQNQWRVDGADEGEDHYPLIEINFKNEAAELPYEVKKRIAEAMLNTAVVEMQKPAVGEGKKEPDETPTP